MRLLEFHNGYEAHRAEPPFDDYSYLWLRRAVFIVLQEVRQIGKAVTMYN